MNICTFSLRRLARLAVFVFTVTAATQCAPAQMTTPRAAVSAMIGGTVKDATNAIIPGAHVQLLRANGAVAASGLSDSAGHFQLGQPAPGDYTLSVTLDGFAPFTRPVRIGAAAVPALAVTLQVASINTNINVDADADVPLTNPETNNDSASVTADDMKNLPMLDDDIVQTLSAFIDTNVAGEGGVTLMIDGVEMKTVGVSPSAIERVSINQDPYSAQYRQPGRGQVEMTTKSATDHYHGSVSFTLRDSALNATPNTAPYYTSTKQPEQRRLYEGYLAGPVKFLPNSGFLFSLTRKELNAYSHVLAISVPAVGSSPAITQAEGYIPTPVRSTNFTLKVSHQYNDHHSAFVLYRFFDGSNKNQGVGGQTLPSAGYTANNFDQDITYHDDLTLGPNKLNQFNILFERNLDSDISNNETPQIVIQGVATTGGAQQDQYNTENNPNISDIFSWTVGKKQQIKFGFQQPNLGRRILEDKTNRQGTYTFTQAGYETLPQAPVSFTIQQGQERFETLFAQPSAFFLDQIQVTPKLTVIPGARYDFQNALPNTKDGIEPHLSVAYAIDSAHGMVLRTGGAMYLRRVGVNVGQQIARYSHAAEQSLLITNPTTAASCYPSVTATSCSLPAQPPSLYEYAPGLQSPIQGYFGMSLERMVTKKSTLTVGYEGFRGWHALRSIDINAPLPPFTSATRPNASYSQIAQLNSGGYQKSDGLNVSYKGSLGNVFSGFLQYTYSHADANTQWSTFFPQNQYKPNDEWSRTNYDERHRISFFGTFYPDKPVTLGVGFYGNTAAPYTILSGADTYYTGLGNARPAGVPRNSVNGGDSSDLELRLGYTKKLHPRNKDDERELQFSASSFNTLNRPNFSGYDNIQGTQDFMQPTTNGWPRRTQLSASYSF